MNTENKLNIINLIAALLMLIIILVMFSFCKQREDIIDLIINNDYPKLITPSDHCNHINGSYVKQISVNSDTNLYADFVHLAFKNLKYDLIKSFKLVTGNEVSYCLRLKYIDSCNEYIFMDYEYSMKDTVNFTLNFYAYVFGDSMKIFYNLKNTDLIAYYPREPFVYPSRIEKDDSKLLVSLFRGIHNGFLMYEEFSINTIEKVIGLYNLYSGLIVEGKNIIKLIPIFWQK